jgi:hypothetical protein
VNKGCRVIKCAILGNYVLLRQEFPQNTKIHFRYEWKDIRCRVHKAFFGLLSQCECVTLQIRICEVMVSHLAKKTAYFKYGFTTFFFTLSTKLSRQNVKLGIGITSVNFKIQSFLIIQLFDTKLSSPKPRQCFSKTNRKQRV